MLKIMRNAGSLNYTATKGAGPVLPVGKNIVHIGAVAFVDDSVRDPFGVNDDSGSKPRNYDDCFPVVAVKVTNKDGGLTERFHFFGFKKYAELTLAEKEMKTTIGGKEVPLYFQDMEKGYALTYSINPETGKKVPIETGVTLANGEKELRPAIERVIDEDRSAIAVRIFCDFLVACRVPAKADLTPEEAVAEIGKFTGALEITVTEDEYEGKSRRRMTNPRLITTAIPADDEAPATANAEQSVKDEQDF